MTKTQALAPAGDMRRHAKRSLWKANSMATHNVNTNNITKILTALVGLIGLVMLVGGGVAWSLTSNQLAAQNMTVAEYSDDKPGKHAGEVVDGPVTAWAQADVIDTHALEATGGKTYAEMDREDPVRATAMDGALLRGALFTSVLAFGVSFMAGGVGITLILLAATLLFVTRRNKGAETIQTAGTATA